MSKVLGRGISALIPEGDFKTENILYIPVNKIKLSPHQVRKHFNEKSIKELADSIKEKGIIQPLLVSKRGDVYELVAGERRLRACKLSNIKEVPVIVKDNLTERDKAEISLIENLQREDLNPYEIAAGYKRLIDEFGITQEELAKRLGKSRSVIANFLRILKYPEYIAESIKNDEITEGHARALMIIKDDKMRKYILRRIIKEKLSVREVEEIAKTQTKEGRKLAKKKSKDVFLKDIEKQLLRKFRTKVDIKGNYRKGKILIYYFSREDLERLLKLLT